MQDLYPSWQLEMLLGRSLRLLASNRVFEHSPARVPKSGRLGGGAACSGSG